MPGLDTREFLYLLPECLLAAAGCALLIAGVLGRGKLGNRASALTAFVALVATAGFAAWVQAGLDGTKVILAGSFILDPFAFYWKELLLVASALTVVLSVRFVEEGGYRPAEYYSLILLATTGMLFMVS